MGDESTQEPVTETSAEETAAEVDEVELQDERAQQIFDQRATGAYLAQGREKLAGAKVAYYLSRKGIAGVQGHPNQHKEAIERIRAEVEALIELADQTKEGPLPEPSPLEIASKNVKVADVVELPGKGGFDPASIEALIRGDDTPA